MKTGVVTTTHCWCIRTPCRSAPLWTDPFMRSNSLDVQLNTHGDNSVTTWSDSGTAEACTSWQQCIQYLDETPVTKVRLLALSNHPPCRRKSKLQWQ